MAKAKVATPEVEERSHDPFAPMARPEPAPSFPEDRLRRAGVSEEDLATGREEFDRWTPDEQREALDALAAMTDDELAAHVADGTEPLDEGDGLTDEERAAKQAEWDRGVTEVEAWAAGAVEAGDYPDRDAAVAALEALRPTEGEVAPGGPGEVEEAPANGSPEAGADPSADAALAEEAQQRLSRGATVDAMKEWVGDDPQRAAAALAAERAGKNRVTLVEALEHIVGE